MYGRSLLEIMKLILILNFINFIPLVSNSFRTKKNEILHRKHISILSTNFLNSYHLLPRKTVSFRAAILI